MYTFRNKLFLVVMLFGVWTHASAQVVDIPDTNFRNALLRESFVDSNHDKVIQVAEAEAIESLLLDDDIYAINFKGLEAFKNLKKFATRFYFKEVFDFGQNKLLEELTLSNYGGMTELKAAENPNLLSIVVIDGSQLETIDVRNSQYLSRLITIDCHNLSKIYVYNKELAVKLTKLGTYSSTIPIDAYEAPNTVLGMEESKVIRASQIVQKGTQIELGIGVIHDVRGNIVTTITGPHTFSFDHFPVGLYFFKTAKGSIHKLVFVE